MQHTFRWASLVTTSALALVMTSSLAHAQSNRELMEIIRKQSEQIDRLERRLQGIENKTQQAEEKAVEATEKAVKAEQTAAKAEETAEANDLGVEFKLGPSPTIQSKDGRFSFKVRGRLLTDYNYVRSDDNPSGNRINTNSTEFRSARLGVEGVAWKDIEYKFEADFADNEVDITDAFLQYNGVWTDPVFVRIGQFKTPNSLEEQTSSRFTTFMERAAFTDAFNLDRRIGAGFGIDDKNYTVLAGVFWQNNGETDSSTNEFGALAARGTYKFDIADELGGEKALGGPGFIHVGASTRWRQANNQVSDANVAGDETVRYRDRPFFHDTNRSIDTGNVDVNSDLFLGPEFALVLGPFSVQSELGWQLTDGVHNQSVDNDDATELWGGYADVSYFVTGETRTYKDGAFDRPKVKRPVFEGGPGAWQVGTRSDFIDLNDGGAGFKGGEQFSQIVGVNWWLNNNVKLAVNYAYNYIFNARGVSTVDGSENEVHGLGVRAQVDW